MPTPYWILAPGSAIDLHTRIVVEGHPPPANHYYLTDVLLRRATTVLLAAKFLPGVRLVKRETVIPSGIEPRQFDRIMANAMSDSKDAAALVAERAAGFAVPEPERLLTVYHITAASRTAGTLRVDDIIESAAGRPVRASADLARAIDRLPAGARVVVGVRRGSQRLQLSLRTIATSGGTRLGIVLSNRYRAAKLPVGVRYDISNVGGSSGGLMFALDIYDALRPRQNPPAALVAGTGTLDFEGRVGPIEGAPQKLIAAKRIGARVFLVPRENYAEIAGDRSLRVVAVGTFREALRALELATPVTRVALGRCARKLGVGGGPAHARDRDRVRPRRSS